MEKKYHMEKIKRLLPFFLAAAVIFAFTAGIIHQYRNTFTNEDFIRFHVVANSDSDEDQNLKLTVRDRLLDFINGELEEEAARLSGEEEKTAALGIEQTREFLVKHIGKIRQEAARIVGEQGYDYPVSAELGVRFIPEKTYGSLEFPAGNYEALTVTIGSGEGKNWWCVLYPPLCLIDTEKKEEDADDVLRDAVMQGKYSELAEAAHGEKTTVLRLRFKTLEWLSSK